MKAVLQFRTGRVFVYKKFEIVAEDVVSERSLLLPT